MSRTNVVGLLSSSRIAAVAGVISRSNTVDVQTKDAVVFVAIAGRVAVLVAENEG